MNRPPPPLPTRPLRLSPWWPLLACATLLLALTAWASWELRQDAKRRWQAQAEQEMARLSDASVYWLEQAAQPLAGLAMLFQGSTFVSAEEFDTALNLPGATDVRLQGITYAYADVSPGLDQLQIRYASNRDPLLEPGRDLAGFAPLRTAIRLSREQPDRILMGPAFLDQDRRYKAFVALPTHSAQQDGSLIALVDLSTLFADLRILHLPAGFSLRPTTDGLPTSGLAADDDESASVVARHTVRLYAAGRDWRFHWQLHRHFRGGPDFGLSFTVLVTGLLITLLSTALLGLALRQRDRAHALDQANRQLHEAMDQLVRTEKLASLGNLVAGIAHELNTPIGNSLTVASSLKTRTDDFHRLLQMDGLRRSALTDYLANTQEAAELLERNITTAATLIARFKQLAVDQTSERRREFCLRELVDEVVWSLSPQLRHSTHTLTVDIPATLRCDSYPGALGQVLTNLISNSLLHGFDDIVGGEIQILARPRHTGWVQLRYSDNGVGIAEEQLRHIFDPFFTTRLGRGGSGLGLHIVYQLVTTLLGGRIQVESEPGQGTRFLIELPLRMA